MTSKMLITADRPLFSVIIPTYNRANKLLRALRSLNTQQFRDFEVLVCDDGSIDNTSEIVEEFRKEINFRELKYLFQSNWGGPAKPRNMGLEQATAEWICYLDSDDTWYPEKLLKMLPYMETNDLIYHNVELSVRGQIKKYTATRLLQTPIFEDLMLQGHNGCIINSTVCVRKDLVIQAGGCTQDTQLIGVEDADLWLKISRLTNKFHYVQEILGAYFFEGDSLTIYNEAMIYKLDQLFTDHVDYLTLPHQRKLARNTHDYHIARIRHKMKQYPEAFKLYLKAVGSPNISVVFRSIIWICLLSVIVIRINFGKRSYYKESI